MLGPPASLWAVCAPGAVPTGDSGITLRGGPNPERAPKVMSMVGRMCSLHCRGWSVFCGSASWGRGKDASGEVLLGPWGRDMNASGGVLLDPWVRDMNASGGVFLGPWGRDMDASGGMLLDPWGRDMDASGGSSLAKKKKNPSPAGRQPKLLLLPLSDRRTEAHAPSPHAATRSPSERKAGSSCKLLE